MPDDEQKPVDTPVPEATPEPTQPAPTPVEQPASVAPVAAAPPAPVNGLAVASLVVGLVAFVSGWVPFWGLLTGTAAVVLGILALKRVHGKALAVTGIITGGLAALTGLIFTAVLVAGIISAANYESEMNDTDSSENRGNDEGTSDSDNATTNAIATVQINTVTRDYQPSGSSANTPAAGNEFILLDISVTNSGSEDITVSQFDFSLLEGDDAIETSFIDSSVVFSRKLIAPGETHTGQIAYEVTEGANNLSLVFEKSYFDSEGNSQDFKLEVDV